MAYPGMMTLTSVSQNYGFTEKLLIYHRGPFLQRNKRLYLREHDRTYYGPPDVLGGKPIIKGTRMPVEFILEILASDVSEQAILENYLHISREDIQACLRYVAR